MEIKAFIISNTSFRGIFFAGVLFLLNLVVHGQEKSLIINAGNDTCVCQYSETTLGGNPTAQGGTEPYTYIWSGIYTIYPGYIYQYASDILNDTTIANPQVIGANTSLESYVLKLHIIDAVGAQAWDSVLVCSPDYTCLLWTPDEYILQGDSVMLFSVCLGGYDPQTYLWEPENGLTDPTDVNTYASPLSTTLYFLNQWDSCGCELSYSMNSAFWVHVIPVGINNSDNNRDLKIIPNPASGAIMVQSANGNEKIEVKIYSIVGTEIMCLSAFTNENIKIENLPSGLYVVILNSNSKDPTIHKLIIE